MPDLPSARTHMRRTILRKLIPGAAWARSFQVAKPVLTGLVKDGLVERVKPPGGRARNMVRLTAGGRAAALEPQRDAQSLITNEGD